MSHFDRLFRSAEVEAEARIGIVRMIVAGNLGLAIFLLIQAQGMPTEPAELRNLY